MAARPNPTSDLQDLLAATVVDADGRAVTLAAATAGEPTVLVFLRHFG